MQIERISPAEALRRQRAGARLIDVREVSERAAGHAEGALGVPRAELEAHPERFVPARSDAVVLICQSGVRSLRAAEALHAAGYSRVSSVDGGTSRWISEALPTVRGVDADFHERYSRHLRLPEVGEAGQRRLNASSVLLVGAGGLGSPVALYLAAAGVGRIVLVDDDVVDRSNLQRQVLHTDARIGVAKVESGRASLAALNPTLRIDGERVRIDSGNVEALVEPVDVVIDGADNFATRYLLNDACVHLRKPLVYGAVHRFEGQLSVFDAGRRRGEAPCYRCLFPEPPPAEAAPNCAEAGVLGVLPGVIGLLQATETVKLLLGIGESLAGRLVHFDALAMRFRDTRLAPDPDCAVCAPGREFPGYIDYARFCASQ